MSLKIDIINSTAFDYVQSAAPEISALCESFFTSFGLTSIIYGRVFYDGRYFLLSNKIDWIKNWYQNLDSIKDTALHKMLQNIPLGEPFYSLWSMESEDRLIKMHNHFDLWHGFDIHYKLEDSFEGWSFCTSRDRHQLNYFYLNNLKLFHRFCLYLREKATSLFDIKDKRKLAVYKENPDFSLHPSIPNAEDVNTFLASLPLEGFPLQTNNGQVKLSKRELDCMFHFSRGKTSKEIGRILNINSRTVETHFLNIKQKTGYYNKSALADILRDNILKWM